MKIKLEGVQETLLIPLAARAMETKKTKPRLTDRNAVDMVEKIDYDFTKFEKATSQQGVIARTMILDREVQQYIDSYPDAVCISIGCGLDTRYQRLKHGKIRWYNLDFPEVIQIRKQLLFEGKNVELIAKSALDASWTEDIDQTSGHVLIILEGILMYLEEMEVIQLMAMIRNCFSGCTILAEIVHPMMAKKSKHHDTVKQTTAVFHWGIASGKEMEKLCDALHYEKEWNLMDNLTDQGLLFRIGARIGFIADKMNKIVQLRMD